MSRASKITLADILERQFLAARVREHLAREDHQRRVLDMIAAVERATGVGPRAEGPEARHGVPPAASGGPEIACGPGEPVPDGLRAA